DFDRRVDTQQYLDFLRVAVGTVDDQREFLLWTQFAFQTFEIKGFIAFDVQRSHAVVTYELQRQYAHADQVGTVDTFIGTCDHGFHAQQLRTFGRPVTR